MREIKFRAWHQGKMTYYHSFNINIGGEVYYLDTSGEWQQDEDKRVLIMQYTGLKDKDGEEIYEGDIIHNGLYGNSIIIWNASVCAFQYAYHAIGKGTSIGGRMTNTLYEYDATNKYEVIGNIYQNPELLTP